MSSICNCNCVLLRGFSFLCNALGGVSYRKLSIKLLIRILGHAHQASLKAVVQLLFECFKVNIFCSSFVGGVTALQRSKLTRKQIRLLIGLVKLIIDWNDVTSCVVSSAVSIPAEHQKRLVQFLEYKE